MWLSIIFKDADRLIRNSSFFNVPPKYSTLFASMLARKPWKLYSSDLQGMSTEDLSRVVRINLKLKLRYILRVMSAVDANVVLLFKTNELLKSLQSKYCNSEFPEVLTSFVCHCLKVSLRSSWQRMTYIGQFLHQICYYIENLMYLTLTYVHCHYTRYWHYCDVA